MNIDDMHTDMKNRPTEFSADNCARL